MAPVAPAPPPSSKREAILGAALRLVARRGLHDAPMSAIAREAGVAAGTAYVYFESKDALLNALYLELEAERTAAVSEAVDPGLPSREQLRRAWSGLAAWHLEHPDASSFLQQCEVSGILTEETVAAQLELRETGVERFLAAIRRGELREVPVQVFYALFAGPILLLSHMREKGEIEVTQELLDLAFEGTARAVLPDGG
jgi:AcrR family transcriptional regulator